MKPKQRPSIDDREELPRLLSTLSPCGGAGLEAAPRCGAAGMRMCHVQGSSGVAARNVPACMVQHGMVGAMDASSPSVCEEAQHGMCEDPCEDPRGFGTNNSQTIPQK